MLTQFAICSLGVQHYTKISKAHGYKVNYIQCIKLLMLLCSTLLHVVKM